MTVLRFTFLFAVVCLVAEGAQATKIFLPGGQGYKVEETNTSGEVVRETTRARIGS